MGILLTGGAGFVGSNLALTLQPKHENIIVVDNFGSGDFISLRDFKGDIVVGNLAPLDLSSKFEEN